MKLNGLKRMSNEMLAHAGLQESMGDDVARRDDADDCHEMRIYADLLSAIAEHADSKQTASDLATLQKEMLSAVVDLRSIIV